MANIVFEKIKIHNFLSFGDAELSFRNKGYVLVSGINKNPKDGALSNGSGKSSIWSAISWALTGETIQGLSSNICNINFVNEGCFVELTFRIDENEYRIIRYKDYNGKKGADLKIFINGEDRSGDGVRKSEALLEQYIPDMTSSLIGSVIILGQGLPHRFTNNTPLGRKEVLEKLSKSDFMIEDIKARISKRSGELATVKRTLEDDLLQANTQQKMYTEELNKENAKLSDYLIMPNFDGDILTKETQIHKIDENSEHIGNELSAENKKQLEINASLLNTVNLKSSEISSLKDSYNTNVSNVRVSITKIESEQAHLRNEILKLDSIKDVCPTCGQKLPHVHKSDTTDMKTTLANLIKQQEEERAKERDLTTVYNSAVNEINTRYAQSETSLRDTLTASRNSITTITNTINSLTREKNTLMSEILQLKNNKSNFEVNKKQIENKIKSIQESISSVKNKILYINKESDILNSHIIAVDKMNSLVKRDFRGFLLTHVIDFINVKAKEYCSYVFETNEIEFKLNGNSIDISYCGKDYENLSGGEKQKVDLIIQFSIRDMLCQYLNFSSNILVLDEITDNLDAKGCDKVINLISNRLTDVESVFIITHHTELLKGLFEGEINVEKDEKGVSKIK